MQPRSFPLMRDRFFGRSLAATGVALLACLATHGLAILGLAGAVAWIGEIEHALLFATVAFAALTVYAWWRHRRGGCAAPETGE